MAPLQGSEALTLVLLQPQPRRSVQHRSICQGYVHRQRMPAVISSADARIGRMLHSSCLLACRLLLMSVQTRSRKVKFQERPRIDTRAQWDENAACWYGARGSRDAME